VAAPVVTRARLHSREQKNAFRLQARGRFGVESAANQVRTVFFAKLRRQLYFAAASAVQTKNNCFQKKFSRLAGFPLH
jgi:hypothetical protein